MRFTAAGSLRLIDMTTPLQSGERLTASRKCAPAYCASRARANIQTVITQQSAAQLLCLLTPIREGIAVQEPPVASGGVASPTAEEQARALPPEYWTVGRWGHS